MQLENFDSAAAYLRKAMELAALKSEQALLARRLKECEAQSVPACLS